MLTEIHSFELFSVSVSEGGDYYLEFDDKDDGGGGEWLILSPTGSAEHDHDRSNRE